MTGARHVRPRPVPAGLGGILLDDGSQNMDKIPISVIHYGGKDPRRSSGGVETFARNLALCFERVEFMTPRNRDPDRAVRSRTPVVCDNQYVLDWPSPVPVIGFQHGVAAVKQAATRAPGHRLMARRQARAANRPNTLWVGDAEWVVRTFRELHGVEGGRVIRHCVDPERFDGRLENDGSTLLLHDARTRHKGKRLIRRLARALEGWALEPLACPPSAVPDRMRRARAFLHLSRYEGNSLVCNEAMAMNLPCLFTRVGLMLDADGPTEVYLVDPERAFRDADYLLAEAGRFLESLASREYRPREWVLANATPDRAIAGWRAALADFEALSGWDLGLDR